MSDKPTISEMRTKVLDKLNDLTVKIQQDEPCFEQPQDTELLAYIDDNLTDILNNWYIPLHENREQ
jgi:hypothetical protein